MAFEFKIIDQLLPLFALYIQLTTSKIFMGRAVHGFKVFVAFSLKVKVT